MRRFETRETWILRINRKRNDPYEEEEEMDVRAMGKKNERENAHYRSMFAQRHPPQEQHTAGARSYPKNQPTGRGAIRKPSGGNHSQFYCVYRRLGVNCITIWLASNAENQPIGHELEQLR